jgi:hypothetical protein
MQEAKLVENAVARPATAKPARTPRQTPTPSLAETSECEEAIEGLRYAQTGVNHQNETVEVPLK